MTPAQQWPLITESSPRDQWGYVPLVWVGGGRSLWNIFFMCLAPEFQPKLSVSSTDNLTTVDSESR